MARGGGEQVRMLQPGRPVNFLRWPWRGTWPACPRVRERGCARSMRPGRGVRLHTEPRAVRRLAPASCRGSGHGEGPSSDQRQSHTDRRAHARRKPCYPPPWPTVHAGYWAAAPSCRNAQQPRMCVCVGGGRSHRLGWGALCGQPVRLSRARRQQHVLCRTFAARPFGSAQPPCDCATWLAGAMEL